MGILSSIFKKKEKIWIDFNGSPNDEFNLQKKAEIITPLILKDALKMAEKLHEDLFESVEWLKLVLECLIININMYDRYSFKFIGPSKRDIFIQSLFTIVNDNLHVYIENSDDMKKLQDFFYSLYQKRQIEYANCDIITQKNEQGGYNIRKTIGWKLAEIYSIEDGGIAGMEANFLISEYYISNLKIMQIKEFFLGY